jgi:hypothetical protein
MADDPLAAALEEVRGQVKAAFTELYLLLPGTVATPGQVFAAGILAGTADKLAGVVEAALGFHQERPTFSLASTTEHPGTCPHGPDDDGGHPSHFPPDSGDVDALLCEDAPQSSWCECGEEWPCGEHAAIRAALTGEGTSGG